jgi:pimeloyl-ACP methyl ester carboxylesterase
VFLHGKGENEDSNLDGPMFAALARLGDRAPDVVFPDGDEDSYWHDRESGAWGRYVIDEVIPQTLRRLHADPRRVAIGGLSIGGFGAYDLARLYPGKFCAVGGDSPALWVSGGESAAACWRRSPSWVGGDGVLPTTRSPNVWDRGITGYGVLLCSVQKLIVSRSCLMPRSSACQGPRRPVPVSCAA